MSVRRLSAYGYPALGQGRGRGGPHRRQRTGSGGARHARGDPRREGRIGARSARREDLPQPASCSTATRRCRSGSAMRSRASRRSCTSTSSVTRPWSSSCAGSAPVVISAHGFVACTSGVHYFRPGQECLRPHGPGCIPNLLRCAHTRDPLSLRGAYGLAGPRAGRPAAGRHGRVLLERGRPAPGDQRDRTAAPGPVLPHGGPRRSRSERASSPRVVFAGRVVAPKGVATLVRAAREVDARFVVCGDGWQLPAMRRLARRLGVEERIEFAGWLDPERARPGVRGRLARRRALAVARAVRDRGHRGVRRRAPGRGQQDGRDRRLARRRRLGTDGPRRRLGGRWPGP